MTDKSGIREDITVENKKIIDTNRQYWNEHADLWFGTTALPEYGMKFLTEDELHFFKDVSGKKVLEICCGSGHSLKYLADRKAGELWGLDLSQRQLENADKLLAESGYTAKLICSPMEAEAGIPRNYFDFVYSPIYISLSSFQTSFICLQKKVSVFMKYLHPAFIASSNISNGKDILLW